MVVVEVVGGNLRVGFGVGELEGTVAGVMEGVEGSVVTGASVVCRGLGGLVDGGEGFEGLVEAILEQTGGAGEEQAGTGLHKPC